MKDIFFDFSKAEGCNIDEQNSEWLDHSLLTGLYELSSIILFGAGQGTIDLFDYIREKRIDVTVKAIADNDSTMWGNSLSGFDIIAPSDILKESYDKVVITTVSGADDVFSQLKGMGIEENKIMSVGNFPDNSLGNFFTLWGLNNKHRFIKPGSTVLHVGPGGNLGLELCLHAIGCSVSSIDAYKFGQKSCNGSNYFSSFDSIVDQLLAATGGIYRREQLIEVFENLSINRGVSQRFEQNVIYYDYPHRFSSLPFRDEIFDVVLSFNVLEHVRKPDQAVGEIERVLKTGGTSFHRITTCDHRFFSQVSGYHPFSHLLHDEHEWHQINLNKFYQNRLLPHDWEGLFCSKMNVVSCENLIEYDLSDELLRDIRKFRPDLYVEHLSKLDCDILTRKL